MRYLIFAKGFLALLVCNINIHLQAQVFASWNDTLMVLDNGIVRRTIKLPAMQKTGISSVSLMLEGSADNFIDQDNEEFFFRANGNAITGKTGWKLVACDAVKDDLGGNGSSVRITGISKENLGVDITIDYLLYTGSPVIRKRLAFKNSTSDDLKIESLDVEKLASTLDMTYTWIYGNYGRYKTINGYTGFHYDPLVILHQVTAEKGIILGNEAPGVLKKTMALMDGRSFTIGYNHAGDDYPLRKWLGPGESWASSQVFIAPYHKVKNPEIVMNSVVPDFVRRHMGIRLSKWPEIPTSIYNTWAPFRGDLTTGSVLDVARNAAQCGFQYFVIDAGWNTIEGTPTFTGNKDIDWMLNLGDWKEDREKFPGGLKQIIDSVEALGMKPGLWISVATSTKNAKVYIDHPDWFVQDEKGNAAFLHDESGNPNQVTACLGSGYYDYILETILRFTRMGVRYVKLDLSIVTSAYRFNPQYTGCSAKNHPFHRDREESYLAIYERCFQLFDELHREAPELFIDCTFETMGKLQLIDFAMLQHAEGNWLTNIDEPAPKGSWRVRQMAWWRSPAIPASSMIIGNMILDEPNYYQSLMSLSGSMPILLGDTRKLKEDDKKKIHDWSVWIHNMQLRHQIMLYRQDLPGFGEPAEGNWDGFQRINTESRSGGIIGVFRQGAAESERSVAIRYLDPDAEYMILSMPESKKIASMSGKELAEMGFRVKLSNKWDGALFEVRMRE